ncbi:hypothetical protein XA68_13371 [Ophiocordyceps unilateralis]|uniref:Uncharacterized protein n=1 Tax=Ophiocordyceps unilateralis TaxID=268505 RepID=A0A2A9PM75_OPHUN|nr:hypothetical protein XA68_13371 [Ophiocordyceps unilateralis]
MQHLRAVTSSAVDALRPVQRFRAAVSAPKASSAAPHKRPKRLPCFAEVLDRAWPGVTGTYKDIFDITSVQQFKSHDVYKTTVKGKKKQGIHPFPKAHWCKECLIRNTWIAMATARFPTVEFCKDDPPPMSQMHDGSTQTQTRRFHDQSTQTDKTSLPRNSRKNFAGYFRRLKSARPARHAEPSSNKKQRASLHPDEAPASTVFAKMKAKKSSRQATASPGPFSEAQPTTSMQPAKPLTAVELKKKAKPVRPPLYASPEERFAVMRQTRPPRPAHPPATVKFDKMRPKGQALPAGLPQRPPRPLRKPTKSGVTKLTDFFTSEQEKKKEQATAAQELRGYLARIKKMKPTKMATKLLPNGQRHSWEHLF